MEASKLTIDPEKLRFQKLNRKQKFKLRKQNVIDLIRSKPVGIPIPNTEFQTVTALRTSGGVSTLMKGMVERGIITRVPADGKSGYSYVVKADVKTQPQEQETEAVTKQDVSEPAELKTLEGYAKDFAWAHGSDSLREFIKYMEKVELDLRRLLSGGGTIK